MPHALVCEQCNSTNFTLSASEDLNILLSTLFSTIPHLTIARDPLSNMAVVISIIVTGPRALRGPWPSLLLVS